MQTSEQQVLKFIRYVDLNRWSANSALLKKISFPHPLVPLSNVLKRVKEPVMIKDEKLYKRITVRLYGQGVLERDELYGKDIGTKRQFVAREGQLIISRIDARNGAFGIVPKELDGAIVTNDFWLFEVQNTLAQYVVMVLSSERFQGYWQSQSSGTTNRQRVNEKNFLATKIALPSYQEKLLADYNIRIQKACDLKTEAFAQKRDLEQFLFDSLGIEVVESKSSESLLKCVRFKDVFQWGYDKNASEFQFIFTKYEAQSFNMRPDWIISLRRGKSPQYSNRGQQIILNQKCNRLDELNMEYAKTVDDAWAESISSDYLTQMEDVLINSTGEGTIGRASRIKEDEHIGLLYDSHMLLLRLNQKFVDPKLFVAIFNSSYGQKFVELNKSAQATKQTELGIENTKRFLLPLPDIMQQHIISSEYQKREAHINRLLLKSESIIKHAKEIFEEAVFNVQVYF